ncbi:SpoIIE family protein phosphatase [Streptomyces sp. WMMC500]|uniref:SpoIIE family protein phosphatase n=1 Tax=Streptomyces sp. WMMC500 TaxID=3015154 RepID=UPI00248B619C|nr:SpoIIE family protein phosphatase [Streptomyces sp. WMMC500]WBB63989.1 SpoIIE family protein phosphatase [Streptomyces sp. WMMC500]
MGHPPPAAGGAQSRAAPDDAGGLDWLEAALGQFMRSTGASLGVVYLLEPDERVLRLTVASGASRTLLAPWTRVPLDAPIPVAHAVRERQPVWLVGQEEMARRFPRVGFVLPYDFACAARPIASGDTVWGGFAMLWPIWHPARLSPTEHAALGTFGRRCSLWLQRAAERGERVRPPEEPRVLPPGRVRSPQRFEAVAAVSFLERLPLGCCELDLEGRITYCNSAGSELMGIALENLLGARPWEAARWLRDPVCEERYRAAVISRRATSFTAVRPPDRRLYFELFPDASGISVHITPVPTGTTTTAAGGRPSESAPEPIGVTALYHLMDVAAALTEAVGLREVVDLVTDLVVPAFGPQGMLLMAAEEGRLRTIGHRGHSGGFLDRAGTRHLADADPAAHALANGVPSFFASLTELHRAYPAVASPDDMAAFAFLPLLASSRMVGTLVLSYRSPHAFPPGERALLTSLAGLIAQALDRARLYDTKLELARSLQAGLLPRSLPPIEGLEVAARYLPAGRGMDIGGDFYDLIRYDETTAAAAIGDVQGHNVNAAALMGQVRTAVHAHAAAGTLPGDLLTRTNRLLADLDTGLFASCLYAHLDLRLHCAHLATAGHPPPLLRHPDGRTEVLPLSPGLLLGIDPAADYPTAEVPLPPGAVLALYTDGLVETPGEDLGAATTQLAEKLAGAGERASVDDLADLLMEGASKRHDDIALMLIRAAR